MIRRTVFQSPFFDGVSTNWFHARCFFTKSGKKPRGPNDIENFLLLSPTDQKRIADNLFGGIISFEAHDADLPDMEVGYAKSGKSGCRGCANAIEEGELRLAIMMRSE